jgi:serine/threonine-protein kinase HipA
MTELVVLLGDAVAGTLTREAKDRLRFDYEPAYRELEDSTPLSRSMPVEVPTHTDAAVRPFLLGLLPENDAVLERWGRRYHVSASSPFALLGTPIGEDCAGGVRFCPPSEVDRLLSRPGSVQWLDESEVAARIRDLRRDGTTWLGRDFTGQFSLAGAQAKTALYFDGSRWGVPSGATPTTHILKPAISGFDDHELNEHLCLDAARRVGLRAVRTRVEQFSDESVVVVTRYDRLFAESQVRRIHQEDLCQALAIPPSRKYQNEGGPSALAVIDLLRREIAPSEAKGAIGAFVDALIWNWVIAGTDAHAKNYSLLLAGRAVRLAPLYDIASALPYGTHERRLRMAMKVGDDYDLFHVWDRWADAAREWGVDAHALRDRVVDITSRTPDAFADAAGDPDVERLSRKGPARLVDVVSKRSRRLLGYLGAAPARRAPRKAAAAR